MRIDRRIFYWVGIGCCLLGLSSCDEDPIPIIPDPGIDPPIGIVPSPNLFQLKVSQSILCQGDQTDILLSDYDNKPKELGKRRSSQAIPSNPITKEISLPIYTFPIPS